MEGDLRAQVADAEELLRDGAVPAAIDRLCATIVTFPHSVAARSLLSRAYYERGLIPFAVRELREILEIAPENKYAKRLLERLAPDLSGKQGEELTLSEVELDPNAVRTK